MTLILNLGHHYESLLRLITGTGIRAIEPRDFGNYQLLGQISELVESHSWATVRVDRNGLQFFWKHVLKMDWDWVEIIKPPQVHTLPDVLTRRTRRGSHH